jgi:hypothetical protein
MKTAVVVSVAAFGMALAGRAQTGYSSYVVTGGPCPPSAFVRAFAAGSNFIMVAADPAGNVYTNSGYSFFSQSQTVQKITPDGDMLPVAGFGAATLVEGPRIPALLAA